LIHAATTAGSKFEQDHIGRIIVGGWENMPFWTFATAEPHMMSESEIFFRWQQASGHAIN
jgi:hypothetical protein